MIMFKFSVYPIMKYDTNNTRSYWSLSNTHILSYNIRIGVEFNCIIKEDS